MLRPETPQPARADCLLVLHAFGGIGHLPYLATQAEKELVQLALGAFGHCLRTEDRSYPAKFTMSAFAESITKVYSVDHPRNAAVVNALHSVHTRMVDAELAGLSI